MLLGHRYYDASVGRFISSDPAKAGDNWYAYCENNPLADTDEVGLDGKKGKGRPKIDPDRGHGPQGTGNSGSDKHSEPRAGDKGNQGFSHDAINRPPPSSPGRRGGAPPSARAERQQEIDRQNSEKKGKTPPNNPYNGPIILCDPLLPCPDCANPFKHINWTWVAGGAVIIGGAIIIVSTGQAEVGGPVIAGGMRLIGAGN